ncbi:MAG TPA: 7-carboxy-7-deazaguanine synthase QueE [Glaciecola sp.]|jgi:7-carboxy-7-deazaguanine synthase|nr:7-carboxy-7-deazaguanine synthase QueE [Glaciecola sp.]
MSATVQYPVNEIFESIQGEGRFTGVPSVFLRLQGCPVGCPWCDTQHTWPVANEDIITVTQLREKNAEAPTHAYMSVAGFLDEYSKRGYQARHIVITGGEPAMHDLLPLTTELLAQGWSVQIETSGTFALLCHKDVFVTVSPKINMPGKFPILPQVMARANEIKHAIAMQKHVDELQALLVECPVTDDTLIYLQPISQQARATELAVATCIKHNWRLSLQTHKFIGIE